MSRLHFIVWPVLGVSLCVAAANAQTAPPLKLKNITGEASRAELFQRIYKEAAQELPKEELGPGGRYIPDSFTFPGDAVTDFKKGEPRKDSHFGIDISHYTGPLKFKDLADKKIRFVYVKATQGTGYKDSKFSLHWSELAKAKATGIRRGAYHFLSAGLNGEEQAKTFVAFVKANGGFGPDDLPPVVDLEWDVIRGSPDRWADGKYTPDVILKQVTDWLKYVKKETGRTPIVYTARSWWRGRNIPDARIADLAPYGVWIADYSRSGKSLEKPAVPADAKWALWQFSDRAKLDAGYARGLDANIFKGTEEQFTAFAKQ